MKEQVSPSKGKQLSADDTIGDLLEHPAFAGFSRLLLPWDDRSYDNAMRLRNVGSLLPYHSHVDPATVVAGLNHMIDDVSRGRTVFYEFYTAAEKKAQPARSNTGLFFFRGKPGAPFAIIAPGGGFSYVGSVHEGFPYAAEISKRGYNAFVLKYRRELAAPSPRAIWPRQSLMSFEMPRRLGSRAGAIRCGAVRLAPEWQPPSARTASRGSAPPTSPDRRQW